MAIYRKYRRAGNSYTRRRRSGYSMYKLYKNRSSASQSRQIYGLNKKLKRIQRLTKPEINIAPLVQQTYRSDQGTVVYAGSNVKFYGPLQLTNLINQDAAAQSGFARLEGRFARLQNITIKGTFTYLGAYALIGAGDLQRQPAYARIVIYQTKSTRAENLTFADVFSSTTSGTVRDSNNTDGSLLTNYALMRAPLALGLARKAKIISDKLYILSDTKQAVNIKTKLKYVRNWYQAPNETAPKGNVMMMVLLYNTSANQEDADVVSASECRLDLISKCVYTDA